VQCPKCNHRFHGLQAIIVEIDGEPRSLREVARMTGVAYSTVRNRYLAGDRGKFLTRKPDPKRVKRGV
jgi:transcription initiation factor TFIIIB Brf1 subunit/transcription initiation factor TFIIB